MAKSSLVINIELSRMYIVQRLAESIAENLRRQYNYDVATYVHLCKDVLLKAGLDEAFVKGMIRDIVYDAYELHIEYKRTGLYTYHNGSGQHPRLLVTQQAQDLCRLMELFNHGLHKESAAQG